MLFIASLVALAAAPPPPVPAQAFGTSLSNFTLSPDGKRLVLAGWRMWDVNSRKQILEVRCYGLSGVAYSPDGKLLACGGNYATLQVFEAKTGKLFWDLSGIHGGGIIHHVEFTPDGRYLVTVACGGMFRVWDVREKKDVAWYCFPLDDTRGLEFQKEIQREHLNTRLKPSAKDIYYSPKTFVMQKVQVSYLYRTSVHPDGKHVAVAAGRGKVIILEMLSGKIVRCLETAASALAVRYSPDGKTLAVGTCDADGPGPLNGTVELWDHKTGKLKRGWLVDPHAVSNVVFSPNGKLLATGGICDGAALWDAESGKLVFRKHRRSGEDDSRLINLAFTPDGKTLLTLPSYETCPEPGFVHFWDIATGKRIMQPLGK